MDKEKQIEEMAKLICLDYNENCHKDCNRSHDCYIEEDIRTIYNAGYRKASEVAREIFEEIENIVNSDEIDGDLVYEEYYGATVVIGRISAMIAELKKKYTEVGNENTK